MIFSALSEENIVRSAQANIILWSGFRITFYFLQFMLKKIAFNYYCCSTICSQIRIPESIAIGHSAPVLIKLLVAAGDFIKSLGWYKEVVLLQSFLPLLL